MGLARIRRMTESNSKTVLSRLALGERLSEAESAAFDIMMSGNAAPSQMGAFTLSVAAASATFVNGHQRPWRGRRVLFGFNRLPGLPEILIAGRERLFLDWLFDHKARRPDAIDAVARERDARSFAAPGAARAGFDYYRALLSTHGLQRMTERVARPLTMPVLAVGADGGVRARLAESLDGAAVSLHSVVLAGGHYLPEDFLPFVKGKCWRGGRPVGIPVGGVLVAKSDAACRRAGAHWRAPHATGRSSDKLGRCPMSDRSLCLRPADLTQPVLNFWQNTAPIASY